MPCIHTHRLCTAACSWPQRFVSKDVRLMLSQVVKQWAQTFGAVYSTHDADSQYVLVSDNANNRAVILQPAGCR
jgi:hypothetical protein